MKWFCKQCRIAVPMQADEFPIQCHCGFVETYEEAVDRLIDSPAFTAPNEAGLARCPHRGPVIKTITRDLLACGCQTIRLHSCEHFAELVTIQPIRRPNAVDTAEQLRAAVSEFFPGYTGRTCRGCPIIPGAIPASHPSKRTD